ncbi:MAG: hypothetical protein EOM34_15290 [Clostridia bacterium]|nr:hypothetical protein [Clostridia bacterium]NCD08606.1 hypothetical protein [Negativicutes bacterium]
MMTDNDSLMLQLIRKLYTELTEYELSYKDLPKELKPFESSKLRFMRMVYKKACNIVLKREEIVALLCKDDVLESCWIEQEYAEYKGAYTLIGVAKNTIWEEKHNVIYPA